MQEFWIVLQKYVYRIQKSVYCYIPNLSNTNLVISRDKVWQRVIDNSKLKVT